MYSVIFKFGKVKSNLVYFQERKRIMTLRFHVKYALIQLADIGKYICRTIIEWKVNSKFITL